MLDSEVPLHNVGNNALGTIRSHGSYWWIGICKKEVGWESCRDQLAGGRYITGIVSPRVDRKRRGIETQVVEDVPLRGIEHPKGTANDRFRVAEGGVSKPDPRRPVVLIEFDASMRNPIGTVGSNNDGTI